MKLDDKYTQQTGSVYLTGMQARSRAAGLLKEHRIHFVPGVNEDLAATSVLGSQIHHVLGESKYDGVVGIWYGKSGTNR